MISNKIEGRRDLALRLSGITKRFGTLSANDNVDLSLHEGEVVALLGENGAGKTTLMNILFGHYLADQGEIEVFGKSIPKGDPRAALDSGIGMVHQHFALVEEMNVLENIVLGTENLLALKSQKNTARERIRDLSSSVGLDVNPDAIVGSLSVGEKQRVEILKALYRGARILILDEPTAVLTPFEAEKLFATLKVLVSEGLSAIFISHKLNEAMEISDRVVVLRKGRVVGEKITRDSNPEELTSLMVGSEIETPQISDPILGDVALELENISTNIPEMRINLQKVSLSLNCGEITGLAGVSGNGQAALASLISGTTQVKEGTLRIFGEIPDRWSPKVAVSKSIARIPEDRLHTGMIGDMSVVENIISEKYWTDRFSRLGFLTRQASEDFSHEVIKNYDVKCSSIETPVRLLSGGNIQKLILGRVLDESPSIILANQPTRGLDVGAVAYVHSQLLKARDRGAAILLISDDLEEILQISDRISVISNGRLSKITRRGELGVKELGALMTRHVPSSERLNDEA